MQYITHAAKGWDSGNFAYIVANGAEIYMVNKDGSKDLKCGGWHFEHVALYINNKFWKIISKSEAEALVKPKYPNSFYIAFKDIESAGIAYILVDSVGGTVFVKDGTSYPSPSNRETMIKWVESGMWEVVTEAKALSLVAKKVYSFKDLETTAPLGTYGHHGTSKPKFHIISNADGRSVLWLGGDGSAQIAEECWKGSHYKFDKLNDVKINMSWKALV